MPRDALPLLLLQRAETSVFERTARRHPSFYQRWLVHRVILDVRDGAGGGDEVRERFGDLHDLGPLENGKGRRIGAIKE